MLDYNLLHNLVLYQSYLYDLEDNQNIAYSMNLKNNYIPYNFFKRVNTFDPDFRKSFMLGIDNDNLYTFYRVNYTEDDISYFTYFKIFKLDLKNYTYNSYIVSEFEWYNKVICLNGASDTNLCGYDLKRNNSTRMFNRNNIDTFNDTSFLVNMGTSYLDDFMYSTKSSDIFIMGLYFFIPLFLFILAIKVLRKGLFK